MRKSLGTTALLRFAYVVIAVAAMASGVCAQDRLARVKTILGKHCLECHNSKTSEADVDLTIYENKNSFYKNRKVWRRVVEMVEAHAMPPEDHEQLSAADRNALLSWVKSSMENVDWSAVRAPGRVPLRRLTREEFQYAVEDLFGVRADLDRLLPVDAEGLNGFTRDHTSLVMTAKQLNRYLKAAEVVTASVVDGNVHKTPARIRYEVEEGTNASFRKPITKDSDGSKGWTLSSRLGNKYQSVSKTFDFDRTGTYRIRMKARCKGPGDSAAAWIAVDSVNDASRETGILVEGKQFDIYETELFITKGRHTILFGYDFYGPLWLPDAPRRAQVKLGQSTFDPPPYDRKGLIPSGVSMRDLDSAGIKIRDEDRKKAAGLIRKINDGYFAAVLDNLMLHKFHYEKGYLPVFLAGLGYDYQETIVPAFNELAKVSGTSRSTLEKIWESQQPASYNELKKIAKLQKEAWTKQDQNRKKQVGDLYIDWIEMESRQNNHPVPPDATGIEAYLKRLLPLAFRQPVDDVERKRFQTIYQEQLATGVTHSVAFERMLIALLVSPKFLYRTDGPEGVAGVSQLDAYSYAAKLSSFLWSSIPDNELLNRASENKNFSEEFIENELDRMLDDDRRLRFSTHFTEQWLNLSDIGLSKEPDKELFRYFSWRLAEDMRKEVSLTFDRIIREDRSILELIDGDATFLNERLARLYEIKGVTGKAFRLVELPDRKRGGLLGTAAILTSTSLAARTSPVRRGQFILETLMGVDLPSPPADVPQLDGDAGQSRVMSLRESLARHRDDPKCAGCHNKIDPLGFSLENYDWIGRWRENDPAGPVQSVGILNESTNARGKIKLHGAQGLKKFLATERKDQFVNALAKALLKYGLGRDLEFYDEHAIRRIVAEVKANDYRSRALIKAVVLSYPFRFREIVEQTDE